MRLGDILSLTHDSVDVVIIDCATGETIAHYDGKDSIDVSLNDRVVVKQYVRLIAVSSRLWVGQLCIEIAT